VFGVPPSAAPPSGADLPVEPDDAPEDEPDPEDDPDDDPEDEPDDDPEDEPDDDPEDEPDDDPEDDPDDDPEDNPDDDADPEEGPDPEDEPDPDDRPDDDPEDDEDPEEEPEDEAPWELAAPELPSQPCPAATRKSTENIPNVHRVVVIRIGCAGGSMYASTPVGRGQELRIALHKLP
jgi:hypothetical protein